MPDKFIPSKSEKTIFDIEKLIKETTKTISTDLQAIVGDKGSGKEELIEKVVGKILTGLVADDEMYVIDEGLVNDIRTGIGDALDVEERGMEGSFPGKMPGMPVHPYTVEAYQLALNELGIEQDPSKAKFS